MPSDRGDLYVGYLPAPVRHRRFARLSFGVVLVLAGGIGFVGARFATNPGEGSWSSEVSHVDGVLRTEPTTYLQTPDGPVLLVEIGKFGARTLNEVKDRPVRCRGTLIARGRHRMLELVTGESAVQPTEQAQRPQGAASDPRGVEVIGEIIDTKCYLGAMKPGAGPTHAACARLCIRGGIPAAIVGATPVGEQIWAVLDPGESEVIDETLLSAVGKPVRLRGVLTERSGLSVLGQAELIP
ncbi:MAG: hypothetical protein AAFO89_00380 [Planctomycetota bacterium]